MNAVTFNPSELDQAIRKFKATSIKAREAAREMDRCCPRHLFWKLPGKVFTPPRAKSRHYLRLERRFIQLSKESGVLCAKVQAIWETTPGWQKLYVSQSKFRLSSARF